MIIKDETDECKIAFDSHLYTQISDKESRFIKGSLHIVTDALTAAALAAQQNDSKELRLDLLEAFFEILTQAREEMHAALDIIMAEHVLNSPLSEKFSMEKVFGNDIYAEFLACLASEKERRLAISGDPLLAALLDEDQEEEE
jgi:hypothetical protein